MARLRGPTSNTCWMALPIRPPPHAPTTESALPGFYTLPVPKSHHWPCHFSRPSPTWLFCFSGQLLWPVVSCWSLQGQPAGRPESSFATGSQACPLASPVCIWALAQPPGQQGLRTLAAGVSVAQRPAGSGAQAWLHSPLLGFPSTQPGCWDSRDHEAGRPLSPACRTGWARGRKQHLQARPPCPQQAGPGH